MPPHVLPHALKTSVIKKLKDKRIILASNSPRRKELLRTIGLEPEIVPSNFPENLPFSTYAHQAHEYPVATATHKAIEVYERLVETRPDDAPDLVIAADTVVLTHAPETSSTVSQSVLTAALGPTPQEILEKPQDKTDNLRMLMDLNGNVCEVVTGVVVIYPVLQSPGYKVQCIDERTLVYFADNEAHVIEAYVENGEGIDRAGGFAIQGLGSLLIRKIDGDYSNVVGFPVASFYKLLEKLHDEEEDFLDI
ncbi:inosine triphosphate pyrophosphatase-like protein [Coprinopsis sp. MPI-PUGE-AT-0042]|nr:inosine triphosphate pyrophosphatase-like protein [Coprinopsis sp. MPI-PUGE-AT-0042]